MKQGIEDLPKGIELEIRLYKNVKKVEFKYMARKLIITDPEALYVAFPFSLPDSRIVFETIGGILTQGQQLPGSSTDWNAAQNFVSVRGKKGQIVIVSNEVPLWQFSDFNMAKWERISQTGKDMALFVCDEQLLDDQLPGIPGGGIQLELSAHIISRYHQHFCDKVCLE